MSKSRVADKPLSGNPAFDGPNYFSSKHWDRKEQIIADKCAGRLAAALSDLDAEGGVDVIGREIQTTADLLSNLLCESSDRPSRLDGWEVHEYRMLLQHLRYSLESASNRLNAIQSYHVASAFAEGEAVDELGNAARVALGFRKEHADVTGSTKALRKLVTKLPSSARIKAELELDNIDDHMGKSYEPDAPESTPDSTQGDVAPTSGVQSKRASVRRAA